MAESGVDDTAVEIERVFRDVAGQAVATLVRNFGDIGLAEDAVQDASAARREVANSHTWPNPRITSSTRPPQQPTTQTTPDTTIGSG